MQSRQAIDEDLNSKLSNVEECSAPEEALANKCESPLKRHSTTRFLSRLKKIL